MKIEPNSQEQEVKEISNAVIEQDIVLTEESVNITIKKDESK